MVPSGVKITWYLVSQQGQEIRIMAPTVSAAAGQSHCNVVSMASPHPVQPNLRQIRRLNMQRSSSMVTETTHSFSAKRTNPFPTRKRGGGDRLDQPPSMF